MRKRVCVLGLLALGVAICLTLTVPKLWPRPGITRANFERIEIGMTSDEVDAILGVANESIFRERKSTHITWSSYECRIAVDFVNNRVTSRKCGDGRPDNRTVWQKLKAMSPWRDEEDDLVVYSSGTIEFRGYTFIQKAESLEEQQSDRKNDTSP